MAAMSLVAHKLANAGLFDGIICRECHQVREHDHLGNEAEAGREILDLIEIINLFYHTF